MNRNSQHDQSATQIVSRLVGRHTWKCRLMHTTQDIQHQAKKLVQHSLHPATRTRRHLAHRRARLDWYIEARVHLGNSANYQLHCRRTYPPASPSPDNDRPINRSARLFDQTPASGECPIQRRRVRSRLPRTFGPGATDDRPLHHPQRAAQNPDMALNTRERARKRR